MNDMSIKTDGATVTILLVEDDDGDAKAVRRAFKKARIANPITRVVDGVAALEFLRSPDTNLDEDRFMLLVDINMPRMDGHTLVAELRADPRLRRLVVLMLTTSRDPADIDAAYNNTVAGYIVKETAGEDFLRLTAMLENYWRVIELPTIPE